MADRGTGTTSGSRSRREPRVLSSTHNARSLGPSWTAAPVQDGPGGHPMYLLVVGARRPKEPLSAFLADQRMVRIEQLVVFVHGRAAESCAGDWVDTRPTRPGGCVSHRPGRGGVPHGGGAPYLSHTP